MRGFWGGCVSNTETLNNVIHVFCISVVWYRENMSHIDPGMFCDLGPDKDYYFE